MPRFKILIEYDGTGLAGWQSQKDFYSVQEAIQKALYRFTQEQPHVQCAGRTDAGVHALGQVAHFDLEKNHETFRIHEALNHFLRDDGKLPYAGQIAILTVEQVSDEFNARFSAKSRRYVYKIVNRRSHCALDAARAWCVHEPLDADAMHDAAQILIGEHDFSSFRGSECQAKSPIKNINRIEIRREGNNVFMEIEAISFLHHQVRNIMGSLKLVGSGKWNKADFQTAFDTRKRAAGGPKAPAKGLYFVSVRY